MCETGRLCLLSCAEHVLRAMLLAVHCLDYHARRGVHEGKPQLLLMHRNYFALAVELASQSSIICIAMCDGIPNKLYPDSILQYIHNTIFN